MFEIPESFREKILKELKDERKIINSILIITVSFGLLEGLLVYSGSSISASVSRLYVLLDLASLGIMATFFFIFLRIIDLDTARFLKGRKLGNLLISLLFGYYSLSQLPSIIINTGPALWIQAGFLIMTTVALIAAIELTRKPIRGSKIAVVAASLILTNRILELYFKREFFSLLAASYMVIIIIYSLLQFRE